MYAYVENVEISGKKFIVIFIISPSLARIILVLTIPVGAIHESPALR